MKRPIKKRIVWMLIGSMATSGLLTGCQPMQPYYLDQNGDSDLSHYLDTATDIEYTDVCQDPLEEVTQSRAPRTVLNPQFEDMEFWDLTLEDAMSHALHNSKVIRTFGQVRSFGQVAGAAPERLSASPDSVATVFDPAIQETSQNGVEQVLSNFDAIFSSSVNWESSDRPQNFVGGNSVNSPEFQQDRVTVTNQIQKRSATGTQWFFRNESIYTGSNNTLTRNTRQVPSDWYTAFEFELRQPLLRNRGTQVNRVPVVLARIRTDLSLIDFETAVMEQLNSVEFAYWELYYFYNNLHSAKRGRDSALAAWQKVNALSESNEPGGEADKTARAKEQYYFFRNRVEQAQRDLFKSETKLRYLMGLAPTDHRLIRPADRPTTAFVSYNWADLLHEGLCRSPAIRRQSWRIKRSEMELIAARNQLLPQFDVVALNRWLGVGDEFNSSGSTPDFPGIGSSAVDQLWDLDNQEFRLGAELEIPLGFRRELTQIRNSEMGLARERAKLQDMELEVAHQLTIAVQDLNSGYRSVVTNFNRRAAAQQEVDAMEVAYLAGNATLDQLLDSQQRQSQAESDYFRALVDYNLAFVTMQLRKGTLLEYNGVVLAEGPWPTKAYFDAVNRARRRDASHNLDYGFSRPNVISRGAQADRCPEPIQPITYTEDPYDAVNTGDADNDNDNDNANDTLEPTPAGHPSRDHDQPLLDNLDNAIDSMTDAEAESASPTSPGRRVDQLPNVTEPRRIQPEIQNPPRSIQPEIQNPPRSIQPPATPPKSTPSLELEFDDLEAARPKRMAKKSVPPSPNRLRSGRQRSETVQIQWRD